ncbi:hypothetical protein [Brevibacterium litoralis]|uniref:hypothetical protein n=1 Tax=Brevibacterium litoralis TaxID=3138935 RepID=UPI0032EAB722
MSTTIALLLAGVLATTPQPAEATTAGQSFDGTYVGTTSQGFPFSLTVADGLVTWIDTRADVTCDFRPDTTYRAIISTSASENGSGNTAVATDGTFTVGLFGEFTLHGRVSDDGALSADPDSSLSITNEQGTCTSGDLQVTAELSEEPQESATQDPTFVPADGTYVGETSAGEPVEITVTDGVADLYATVDRYCPGSDYERRGAASVDGATLTVNDDGSLSATPGGLTVDYPTPGPPFSGFSSWCLSEVVEFTAERQSGTPAPPEEGVTPAFDGDYDVPEYTFSFVAVDDFSVQNGVLTVAEMSIESYCGLQGPVGGQDIAPSDFDAAIVSDDGYFETRSRFEYSTYVGDVLVTGRFANTEDGTPVVTFDSSWTFANIMCSGSEEVTLASVAASGVAPTAAPTPTDTAEPDIPTTASSTAAPANTPSVSESAPSEATTAPAEGHASTTTSSGGAPEDSSDDVASLPDTGSTVRPIIITGVFLVLIGVGALVSAFYRRARR